MGKVIISTHIILDGVIGPPPRGGRSWRARANGTSSISSWPRTTQGPPREPDLLRRRRARQTGTRRRDPLLGQPRCLGQRRPGLPRPPGPDAPDRDDRVRLGRRPSLLPANTECAGERNDLTSPRPSLSADGRAGRRGRHRSVRAALESPVRRQLHQRGRQSRGGSLRRSIKTTTSIGLDSVSRG
jgi:hypothetical protein